MKITPSSLGYRWPAEWEPHAATWLSWPHNQATWPTVFDSALAEYREFANTIASLEPVHVLASGRALEDATASLAGHSNVAIHDVATNDAWIRDYGPMFLECVKHGEAPALLDWTYNAWGEKYLPFDLDNLVPTRVAKVCNRKRFAVDCVLEGGAIDGNGSGICLATESSVLNANRNPGMTKAVFEMLLHDHLAIDHVIWLAGEIPGDDTDGHVDQIARFVDQHHVIVATDNSNPTLSENVQRIRDSGLGLTEIALPMPSPKYLGAMRLPASYANFYMINSAVCVPQFGDRNDDRACKILAEFFDDRDVIGLPAISLVAGLGAFHCLSQQENGTSRDSRIVPDPSVAS